MGVNLNFYAYYGIRLPYIEEISAALDTDQESWSSHCLFDGMSGEYIIVGERLWDSGDARYAYSGSNEYREYVLTEQNFEKTKQEILDCFRKDAPHLLHYVDKEWKLLFIPHYH